MQEVSLLEAALAYASKGWKVFPCKEGGKAPATRNGFKDATCDTEIIRSWWDKNPSANVAYAPDPGVVIIDVDPRNGGQSPPNLPKTLTALTGGGGYHYYFRLLSGYDDTKLRSTLSEGVDVKGHGTGYVLVPPSVTEQGYTWEDPLVDISVAPQWLIDQLIKPEPTAEAYTHEYYDDPTDMRPGTVFNRTATWSEVLIPHGWRVVGHDSIETYWCRPGKSEGISATTNYQDTDLMHVFTSSTILEAARSYSKFSVYTELGYGGDYSAAAASLGTLFAGDEPRLSVPTINKSIDGDTNRSTRPLLSGKDLSREPTIPLPEPSISRGYTHISNPAILGTVPSITNVSYNFTSALPPDHFISKYIDYVSSQTDAPLEYAEAASLSLLAMAAYKCKAALAPYPGGLSNNLYLCLVGSTTRSRKSTVQRITSNIIKQVMPPSLLPNRATTEALIKALANRNGVPSVWCPDEFGITLAEIYNRDYMRGLEEMLLTVYSGDDYEYQRVLDSVLIRSPHLSVLGAATPESLARAGTTALDSGLLPRFGIVYPAIMPDTKPVKEANISQLRAEKQYFVSKLNEILTWSNTNQEITFDQDSLLLLNTAEASLSATSAVRLPTMLYKVSALIAVADKQTNVRVSDATAAIAIVSRWAEGVATLIPQMYKHGADQQFEQQLEYVIDEIHKHGNSLLRVDIANLINVKKQRLDEIESTLVDKGKIRVLMGEGGKQWHLVGATSAIL